MRDLSKFRASARLVRALRQSPLTAAQLAAPVALTATRISEIVHRKPFGAARLLKVLALAASVGVPTEHATVRVR